MLMIGCSYQSPENKEAKTKVNVSHSSKEVLEKEVELPDIISYDKDIETIHILVALCDNKYQGIVPVPAGIGNGQDPKNNLYWGTAYGIKTFFKRSEEWKFISSKAVSSTILERAIFKHKTKNIYLVADAYDGQYIKQTTEVFLRSSAGLMKDVLSVEDKKIGIYGNSKLVAYIGHDGLMDFKLQEQFVNKDGLTRDAIILACYSKDYFAPHLAKAKVNPLVWTTGLMAPEAYTIHDAITGYLQNESNDAIRVRAAKAYSKYQKCSLNAAKNLLVTGGI